MIDLTQTAAIRGGDLASFLSRWAKTYGDKPALRHGGRVRTYRELDDRATQVAAVLADLGVGRGDRVAVLSRNRVEMVDVFFGILRLGAIVVPLNTRLHPAEVSYQVADSGCRVIVGERELLAEHAPSLIDDPVVVALDQPGAGDPWVDLSHRMRTATPSDTAIVDAGVPAFIMYTSGTTGAPKGAVLSHHGLVTRTYCGLLGMGVSSSDEVWYSGLPLFHIGGWCSVLMYLFIGGTTVIAPTTGFSATQTVDEMVEYRSTGGFFVPTQWDAICAAIEDGRAAPPLRRLVWGASPASRATLQRMAEAFPGVPNISAFGQTEMSSATCMLRGEDSVRKMGSVGRPLPGVAVRIVDDSMNDVPVGEVGEIVYQGPTVFLGYWNRPAETAAATSGGWFHSGDLCRMDDEGFIWVVDRKTDMIVSGGENIYCAELESVISTHPGVAEVAVIGVPHSKWGETPLAVVVAADPNKQPSASDVISHAAARLASFKRPSGVQFVTQLPRNASGKVLKGKLRDSYARGSDEAAIA